MSFGNRIKTTSPVTDDEILDLYDINNITPDKVNEMKEITALIKFNKEAPSMYEIYSRLASSDFSFKFFLQHLSKGNAHKDWLYYANSFYTNLLRQLKRRGNDYAIRFVRENKEYSALISNWIFNNHILNYGLHYKSINKSICIYSMDNNAPQALIRETYQILRNSGCFVHPTENGNPLHRVTGSAQLAIPNLSELWDRHFTFVETPSIQNIEELRELKRFICYQDNTLFYSRFPLVLSLTSTQRDTAARKFMMEFEIES